MKLSRMNYSATWDELVDRFETALRNDSSLRWPEHNRDQAELQALGSYKLLCFAERIAKNPLAPWGHLTADQALQLYLFNKHHWNPETPWHPREEDLLFLLREELAQMKLTQVESEPIRSAFESSPSALELFSPHWG